jgi:hypothetical protein
MSAGDGQPPAHCLSGAGRDTAAARLYAKMTDEPAAGRIAFGHRRKGAMHRTRTGTQQEHSQISSWQAAELSAQRHRAEQGGAHVSSVITNQPQLYATAQYSTVACPAYFIHSSARTHIVRIKAPASLADAPQKHVPSCFLRVTRRCWWSVLSTI